MSKFDNDKVMPRYMAIALVLTLVGIAVVGKAFYIMTAQKQYWTEVAGRLKRDSVVVKPNRGNILSSDGQLMASSIPEYRIFMDFQASAFEDDSLWLDKVDSVCEGLHRIWRKVVTRWYMTRKVDSRRWALAGGISGRNASTTTPIWR